MGFLDLFRKKKPEESEELTLSITEVMGFYESKLSDKLRSSDENCRRFRSSILEKLNSLSLKELEKAKFNPGDSTYAAVNMAKQAYITKFKTLLGTRLPTGNDYKSYSLFQKEASQLVKELKSASPKQMIILSNYFKSELSGLVDKVKSIESDLALFSQSLEQGPLEFADSLTDIVSHARSLLERKSSSESKEQSISEQMNSLEKEISSSKQALTSLMDSQEWKEMETAGDEVRNLEGKAETLKFRIVAELASLKRPLKKAKHIAGKDPAFDSFISSPLSTLITETGKQRLEQVLDKLRSLVQEDKLSLKDSEKDKLSLDMDLLSRSRTGYISLLEQMKEKKALLSASPLPKKREAMESRMHQLKERLSYLYGELKKAKRLTQDAATEAESKKREIEKLIFDKTGDKVTVNM